MSLTELRDLYDRELQLYREQPSDWQAGIVEGIKRIIEIMENES